MAGRSFRALALAALPLQTSGAIGSGLEGSRITIGSDGRSGVNHVNRRPELVDSSGSRGLPGGGHIWEVLARAGLELSGSSASADLEFDSEADALFAYSASRPAIEALAAVVERIATDAGFRERCPQRAVNAASWSRTVDAFAPWRKPPAARSVFRAGRRWRQASSGQDEASRVSR